MQCAASHDPSLDITFIWSLDGRVIDLHKDSRHYERTPVWNCIHQFFFIKWSDRNNQNFPDCKISAVLWSSSMSIHIWGWVDVCCLSIFIGMLEMENNILLKMNMTLEAISHSFPEWNNTLYIHLIAISASSHYWWHDVVSLSAALTINWCLALIICHSDH